MPTRGFDMKRFRWISIATFFIVVSSLLPLALTSPAQADSGKINLKELTNGADSILVGTVVERSSYWNEEHTQIYTSVAFSIDDRLKDTTNQDRVTITFLGGEAEGIGAWVSDMPSFDEGEEAMVFLKKLAKTQMPETKAIRDKFPQDEFEVYDGYRGKFAVNGGKIGNLSAGEFKGRVNGILSGQAIPDTELYVTPTPSTSPYLYNGYSWPHPPAPVVSYRINENTSDCTGEGVAVQNAAATWSVPANFTFSYAGTTTHTSVGYDLENDILWVNLGSISTIARATWWYMEVDGTIVETDIEFNDYYSFSASTSCPSGYYDVESIALHELGHWLNLGDLYGAGDADKVMYGYGSTGTTKRVLHSDDIAGIQSIYGASSAPNGTEKLVGSDDAACDTATTPPGNFILWRFQAEGTGDAITFRLKATTSGNVKVAIYADSGGQPGARLSYVNTSAPVVPGWNDITISSTPIVAGNYYWLAFISDGTVVCRTLDSQAVYRAKLATFSTFSFPNPAGTGFSSFSGRRALVAGWSGSGLPPAPPEPPSLLSPGSAITFKWGTSTGATTYWLQVNTASAFTGTDMFDAEVGNVTSQEVTGLSLGTTYYWRVKAGNASGWSGWSSARSVVADSVP